MTNVKALVPRCPKCGYTFENALTRRKQRSEKAEQVFRKVVEYTRYGMQSSKIAKKLGISRQRVWQIQQEHARENALTIKEEPIERWIGEALDNYHEILRKGFNLLCDAEKIIDQKEQVNARSLAISKIIDAQRAIDNLFKQSGLYKETTFRFNINIHDSPEWKELEQLIIAFLESKAIEPTEFVDFVENAKKGPTYRYNPDKKLAAVDAEYTDLEQEMDTDGVEQRTVRFAAEQD